MMGLGCGQQVPGKQKAATRLSGCVSDDGSAGDGSRVRVPRCDGVTCGVQMDSTDRLPRVGDAVGLICHDGESGTSEVGSRRGEVQWV